MKKIVEEVGGEGLESLLGEEVIIFCMNYFYSGRLVGVNKDDVLLENAGIVYETGSFDSKTWKDEQKISCCSKFYVRISAIESYGLRVKKC